MTKEEVLQFVQANPVFQLATVEDDTPRVRSMMMALCDERGMFFSAGTNKDMHRQMQVNPKVELCFYNPQDNLQVRISGQVELQDNLELKEEIVEKFPFLKPMIHQFGWDSMAVYQIKERIATDWSIEKIFAPKKFVPLD